jgi:hypothetical protein
MTTQLWLAYGFALVGLVIVSATVVQAIRAGSAPFGFSAGKDGVKVETNFVGAGLLAGLFIFAGAGYFALKDYEHQIESMDSKIKSLQEITDQMRQIDMTAKLVFPLVDASSISEVVVVLQHGNGITPIKLRVRDGFNANEKTVEIPGLRSGDLVQVTASYALPNQGIKTFRSKQIQIPNSLIEMADIP